MRWGRSEHRREGAHGNTSRDAGSSGSPERGDPTGGVALRRRLAATGPGHPAQLLEELAATAPALGTGAIQRAVAGAIADQRGTGPALEDLWLDGTVTDVLVNGDGAVWVDRGNGLQRTGVVIQDVRGLARRLAAAAGKRLDDAAPIADGRLPDGTRLHAVLAPLAATGACISLRRHRVQAVDLAAWQAGGGTGRQGMAVLLALVDARANVLISGATGSGKTTLLAAMLGRAGTGERLVCIEEARELAPVHPHVVHLQARAANVQGAGEISLADLVRAALRMRPDRLVLGECRGAEVREVLMALNTGHDGGMATVHANAAADVPARLIALASLAGMDAQATAVQAVSAIDAVVHLTRQAGRRVVSQIAVLALDSGSLVAPLAMRRVGGDLEPDHAWERLARRLEGAHR